MTLTPEIASFLEKMRKSIKSDTFVKLTLSKMVGEEPDLKNVYVRSIVLKDVNSLSFTMRYATRDEVKNYGIEEGIGIITLWLGETFLNAGLMTTEADYNLIFNKKRKTRLLKAKASFEKAPEKSRDGSGKRLL